MEQETLIEVKDDGQTLVLMDGRELTVAPGDIRHYHGCSGAADHALGDLGRRRQSIFWSPRESPWNQGRDLCSLEMSRWRGPIPPSTAPGSLTTS